MIKSKRQKQILELLKENGGFISVLTLSEKLYASPSSIRRDLTQLENLGSVKRAYGGAELINTYSGAIPFNYRYPLNEKGKKIIAKKALPLIKEKCVIFMDQSSTAFYLATMLPNLRTITVVTNNLEILTLLSNTNINVISSGGNLHAENRCCLVGKSAEETFYKFHADYAFISSKSLSGDGVVSDCTYDELPVREAMIKNADKKVLLCDGSKVGEYSAYIEFTLKDVDYLVSDVDLGFYQKTFPNLTIL